MTGWPLRPLSSLAVLVIAAACSSPTPDPAFVLAEVPSTAPSLVVEVGTGTKSFVAVEDGGLVELTYGPQGGFHIWTAIRVRGATASGVQVNLRARLADGSFVGPASRSATTLDVQPDGSATAGGLRNYVENASELRGKRVTLEAEVVAADARHGAGRTTVVVR